MHDPSTNDRRARSITVVSVVTGALILLVLAGPAIYHWTAATFLAPRAVAVKSVAMSFDTPKIQVRLVRDRKALDVFVDVEAPLKADPVKDFKITKLQVAGKPVLEKIRSLGPITPGTKRTWRFVGSDSLPGKTEAEIAFDYKYTSPWGGGSGTETGSRSIASK